MKAFFRLFPICLLFLLPFATLQLDAQDWVHTGTNLGADRIRIAAADFKPVSADPQTPALKALFDATLYADLGGAGIFDLVSKSLAPQATPGSPQEISLPQWSAPPANAAMVAFGSLSVTNGRIAVSGWLFDARNTVSPQVLAKQYSEPASEESARTIAHRFADEIILRLGGGINGIAETKIYFISTRSGTKEVWMMDYDGQNQQAVTHLGTISISPRISPDNSRLAFASLGRDGWTIRMYSFELNRYVAFTAGTAGGSNQSPAWSADGSKIAFSSSRTGNPEIWLSDASGGNLHKLTAFKGPNVAPTFNPRTGAQIAWVSGRTGLPQIYTMDIDGSNVQRITDGGYAVSPSWSPNGQLLAFSWNRKYGPGDPGGDDIHVIDLASKDYLQITHESGSNDFPSWAPDGRHIVFQRTIGSHTEIWTMLADGTQQQQLTHSGNNSMPNWTWK
ncbi:MAG TPA: Tol-Pal system beta propeller repeat protein TolB [Terracidiphilus sp.]|nr:Tol-Pal system beta propeller repeat protein TolB [Terracidiphilus sp.]